jgi:predicted nucleotidyltransferase
MLTEADKEAIVRAAKRYGASRVLLFGSSARHGVEAADIDIAVEGVPPSQFFDFYAAVMFSVSKPVDVVDLSEESLFTDLIRDEAVTIYE